jgi:8-amino-7-oxononanoate synthase
VPQDVGIEPLLAGRSVQGPASARVRIDGREYVNFFGSGYLALGKIPEIRQDVERLLAAGAPFASTSLSLLGAREPSFDEVEHAAALACGTETSVYFATGYLTGSVGTASLDAQFGRILIDEHAHYSLRDAAKLTGLPCHSFAHCDLESLSGELKKRARGRERPLVLTDGAFATTGQIPPLADYARLLAPYEGRIFVDEAHSFGVVGERGRGAVEYWGVEAFATGGATLSKAYCAQGAILGCSAAIARRLRTSPPVSGACAGSPLSAAAATASLRYAAGRPELRQGLRAIGDYFRAELRKIGVQVIDTPAPIVSFRYGTRADMRALQRRAFERGIVLYHSNYLGAGAEGMMRCAVFRDHVREDIDALVETLK